MKIGFMQGRLSPIENNLIQSFPSKNWQNEICLASKNSLDTLNGQLIIRIYTKSILNPDGLEEVKKLKRKYNICIPSLTGDCFMQKPFWKESKSFKKKLQDDFINILYGCKKVSISIVLIPLVDNGSIENAEQEEILFEFLSSKKDLIEELSLKVCFESDFSPKRLKKFISAYDKNIFGINYDTGNSAAMGYSPIEEFQSYGERIINIHVKDRPYKGSTVPLGKGDVNFDLIFELIKKYNYNGNLILQTARSKNNDHLGVLLKYYSFVQKFIKKHNIKIKNGNET